MRWSFSARGTFRRCPRQWFYKQVFASSLANDPTRREAQRLSKLESVQAWRGKIVDKVISETIIPRISARQSCSSDEAKRQADNMFDLERTQRLATDGVVRFFEVEYGLPLTKEVFDKALTDIHTSLENFFAAERVWEIFRQAQTLVPQRALSFKHGTASVRVVPDLITFQNGQAPAVLDWKVNTYPSRDYWLQLVTGAIAVTKCNPHRDWPNGATLYNTNQVQLFEVQLLAGDVRIHTASENDVHEAEDFISISATEMELAGASSDPKNLQPKDYPVTSEPRTCQTCSFRKLCWEAGV